MNKRGQGMPMNVIIIAAIALLVLVVLSIVFVNNIAGTNKELGSCESTGGTCKPAAFGCAEQETQRNSKCYQAGSDKVDATQICCIKYK